MSKVKSIEVKGFLSVPDNLPKGSVDIIYCPSYNMVWNCSRLTALTRACVMTALQYKDCSVQFIFSNAYVDYCRKEADFKSALLQEFGVELGRVSYLYNVSDTYEEIREALSTLKGLRAQSVLIIAEHYHMPRLLRAWGKMAPELEVYWRSVKEKYEITREPSLIKSVRMGYKSLWVIWNLLMILFTPILIYRAQRLVLN